MRFIFIFLVIVFSLNSFAKIDSYTVKLDHINHILYVESCFQQAPDYLYTISNSASQLISHIKWNQKNIRHYKGHINLPKNDNGCLKYTVNSRLINGQLNSKAIKQQHPVDTLLEISDWLWLRSDTNQSSITKFTFIHDVDVNVSTPWQLISRTNNKTSFQMKYTPDSWVGYMAFGAFDIIEIKENNTQIHLAIINGINTYNQSSIVHWIKQMTSAVSSISNGFPVKQVQVMVFLQKGSKGVVPWGQVNRYGGSGVFFVVNPERSHQELINDWTAAHEFSHFLLPYTPGDRWLAEGFASYHQNISRARVGLLDEKSTWEKLLAGFKRGQKTADRNYAPTLKYAKGSNRMQMYWGGAVIALKADVTLQKETNGRHTLSDALAQLSHCCLETSKEWSASETFKRLDDITNTKVFTDLYEQEVKKSSYPDYQELLKNLGILQRYNGQIILDDSAINSHIRKTIING